MGCGDECPFVPGVRYEDWELDDPSGQPIEKVRVIGMRSTGGSRIFLRRRETGSIHEHIGQEVDPKMRKSNKKGGWTYVVMPDSVSYFGTRRLVRVNGTVGGHPIRQPFMALGGEHRRIPIGRIQAISKEAATWRGQTQGDSDEVARRRGWRPARVVFPGDQPIAQSFCRTQAHRTGAVALIEAPQVPVRPQGFGLRRRHQDLPRLHLRPRRVAAHDHDGSPETIPVVSQWVGRSCLAMFLA